MINDQSSSLVSESPTTLPIPDDVDCVTSAVEGITFDSLPIKETPHYIIHLAHPTGIPLSRRPFDVELVSPIRTTLQTISAPDPERTDQETSDTSSQSDTSSEVSSPRSTPPPNDPRKPRRLPILPELVLEAPGIVNDFYWNILSWSSKDILGVALD